MIFPQNDALKLRGDIRNTNLLKQSCKDHDVFISLACISNDRVSL